MAGVLAEELDPPRSRHATELPLLVERVLRAAGRGAERIDAVAVSHGPGSYTGLRVGIGFAQGLAFRRRLPVVGVDTLEALAHGAPPADGGRVGVCTDARRGEAYVAVYERRAGDLREVCAEQALPYDEAAGLLARELGPGDVLVGDAFEKVPVRNAGVEPVPCAPSGGVVARLGARALAAGERSPALPRYLRAPAADPNARGKPTLTRLETL